jgi:uncharacterized DUF497 family protein
MKFSWDSDKERINRRKHKVTFFDACHVFADQCVLPLFDDEHSLDEERWISMGQIPCGCAYLLMPEETGICKNYFGEEGKQKGKSGIF